MQWSAEMSDRIGDAVYKLRGQCPQCITILFIKKYSKLVKTT